ncbi:MAG: nuclear transport factor 2 family protein [Stappiaceae bacterium]
MDETQIWLEKLKIQELLSHYVQTLDGRDPEGWAKTFTVDGVFQMGDVSVVGRTKLAAIAKALNEHVGTRHVTTSPCYEINEGGGSAQGQITMVATIATPKGYRIFAAGRYVDRLKKIDGEWLLARRQVIHETLPNDPSVSVDSADPIVLETMRPVFDAVSRIGETV